MSEAEQQINRLEKELTASKSFNQNMKINFIRRIVIMKN